MSLIREISRAVRVALVLWLVTGLIYPLLMLLVGQVIFPDQANGSLIRNPQGEVVGSALIGQPFTAPQYFTSRPSTVNYSTGEDAAPTGVSGASNLAPSNPELLKRIREDVTQLKQANTEPTADLIYTTGSGLDPHISVEAASAQVNRVARARSLPPEQVQTLIAKNTNGRFFGIFGEPGVNLLKLNLALDALRPAGSPG